MSKTRMIKTKFWEDNYTIDLDPIEKLLFLHLLTNPMTNVCGVYEIPLRRIAFDTGIEKEMVTKLLERFTTDDKIFYIKGWIFITNFTKHQVYNENMKIGARKVIEELPEDIKLILAKNKTITEAFLTVGIEYRKPKLELELELKPKSKDIVARATEDVDKSKVVVPTKEVGIPNLLLDKQKHIQIIGHLIQQKGIKFENKKQQQDFLKRNIKASAILKEYEISKIMEVMVFLGKTANYKWGLETVYKYINEDLESLAGKNKDFSKGGFIGNLNKK